MRGEFYERKIRMTVRPEPDLQQRILQLLDGELTADEVSRLDAELRADRGSRALYLEMAALHSALQNRYAPRSHAGHAPLIPIARMLARQRQRMVRYSLLAAALILIAPAIFFWFVLAPGNKAPLASFQVAPDSSFSITHSGEGERPAGNLLRVGSRLRLSHGIMEAEFATGVRCVIEAPCDLVVTSHNSVSLAEGVAWFDVPPAASGFIVETSQLKTVDIGTRFGVVALPGGWHEVHVTKGSVEVSSLLKAGATAKLTLRAGQARRMDTMGNLVATPFDGDRFTTALAKPLVVRNADFDSADADDKAHDPVGYGPISSWGTSGSGIGIGDKSKPFLNQTAHSGSHVAFIQGSGIISQSVSGFDPEKKYTVTYFVSERGLPRAATRTSVSLDLGTSSYSLPGNISRTDAFRRIVSEPLAVFGPTANIQIRANRVSGDAALLIDSVSISRAAPSVPDGGFESPAQPPGTFRQATGNGEGSLVGSPWAFHGGGGIAANSSDFAAPMAQEGSQAAVLQEGGASFSSSVKGFEPGVSYRLSLAAAGRRGGAVDFHVMIGGKKLLFDGVETLTPDIGSFRIYTSKVFTTAGGDFPLIIESKGSGSSFIDDIRFEFMAEAEESN